MDLLIGKRTQAIEEGLSVSEVEHRTLEMWQERWPGQRNKAAWTKRLIPRVINWATRKWGEVGYHLAQLLTGHGSFAEYLYRFKRTDTPNCRYCGQRDTVEHTFFVCPRWSVPRGFLWSQLGESVLPKDIVARMLHSECEWNYISDYARTVVTEKEKEERT